MSSLPYALGHEREQTDTRSHVDTDASNLEAAVREVSDEQPPEEQPSAEGPNYSTSSGFTLPEIPADILDLDLEMTSLIHPTTKPDVEKVQKRASNVLKLAQENEKLRAELKAMTDRLEAAERRRERLAMKEQKIMEAPSS
ncbi:hypothetical protein LshimejAT787_0205790 [Lyophyllum shimeji]|uniref:Uncharacterized protein n=1 Tax=Lyophyllum shimeji TaxID=47721 RepID=A0A9P3PGE4_LYOSH|nr:hypothetical protein LshimejAT787_0205790 [Lyophyllum shimeji]